MLVDHLFCWRGSWRFDIHALISDFQAAVRRSGGTGSVIRDDWCDWRCYGRCVVGAAEMAKVMGSLRQLSVFLHVAALWLFVFAVQCTARLQPIVTLLVCTFVRL